MTEYCVSCGAEIPEGTHICKTCEELRKSEVDVWFCRKPMRTKADRIEKKIDKIIEILEKEKRK